VRDRFGLFRLRLAVVRRPRKDAGGRPKPPLTSTTSTLLSPSNNPFFESANMSKVYVGECALCATEMSAGLVFEHLLDAGLTAADGAVRWLRGAASRCDRVDLLAGVCQKATSPMGRRLLSCHSLRCCCLAEPSARFFMTSTPQTRSMASGLARPGRAR
jgi:hypothetical protein